MFSISNSRKCAASIWLLFIFLDFKLSPTEMGMQMLYAFQHCLEFISAVCLKLDLYLSSCHFCVPVFKILRVLSMNKSRNNMSWIKEEHYFVAVSKVKILKLKHHWMSGKAGHSWTACFFSCWISFPSAFSSWSQGISSVTYFFWNIVLHSFN